MKPRLKPECYAGCARRARKGGYFCTQSCAAEYAEELVAANEHYWCPTCKEYQHSWASNGDMPCVQCGALLIDPTRRAT